eukprot:9194112-Ditylum_brightwellii.AAC.1
MAAQPHVEHILATANSIAHGTLRVVTPYYSAAAAYMAPVTKVALPYFQLVWFMVNSMVEMIALPLWELA